MSKPGGYSWEFFVGVCCPILQILTLSWQTKKTCHPRKKISIFKSVFNLHILLLVSYLFGIETIIRSYALVVSSKKHFDSKLKWAKYIHVFRPKSLPFGTAHTYMAYNIYKGIYIPEVSEGACNR